MSKTMVLPSGDTSSDGHVTSFVSNSIVSAVLRTSPSGRAGWSPGSCCPEAGAIDCAACAPRPPVAARQRTAIASIARAIFITPPGAWILLKREAHLCSERQRPGSPPRDFQRGGGGSGVKKLEQRQFRPRQSNHLDAAILNTSELRGENGAGRRTSIPSGRGRDLTTLEGHHET